MIQILTLIQKFVDIVGAEKLDGLTKAYGTWTESPTAMMPSGLEGINVNGYWGPGELVQIGRGTKFAYGWVPVPSSNKGKKIATAGGHDSCVPKGTQDADEGFQIIEYLNQPRATSSSTPPAGSARASRICKGRCDSNTRASTSTSRR